MTTMMMTWRIFSVGPFRLFRTIARLGFVGRSSGLKQCLLGFVVFLDMFGALVLAIFQYMFARKSVRLRQ